MIDAPEVFVADVIDELVHLKFAGHVGAAAHVGFQRAFIQSTIAGLKFGFGKDRCTTNGFDHRIAWIAVGKGELDRVIVDHLGAGHHLANRITIGFGALGDHQVMTKGHIMRGQWRAIGKCHVIEHVEHDPILGGRELHRRANIAICAINIVKRAGQ